MAGKKQGPKPEYKILPKSEIEDGELNWSRRGSTYPEIVNAVLQLKPGEKLPILFPDRKTAEGARNSIRNAANRRANAPKYRGVVQPANDGTSQYVVKMFNSEGAGAEEEGK